MSDPAMVISSLFRSWRLAVVAVFLLLATDASQRGASANPASQPSGVEAIRAEPASPETLDVTFRVMSSRPGQSFRSGMTGKLRISQAGIAFRPDDGDSKLKGWRIEWRQIEGVGEAEGLWDVRHPIVVTAREGRNVYLVECDAEGVRQDSDLLLTWLRRGHRRARSLEP